jgi:hypothetical protein
MEASEPNTEPQPKRQKHRSPSYPALDLETALHRAEQLEKVAGRHPAPMTAALSAWGYSAKSSNGPTTLAALKKFGLADDSGQGKNRAIVLTRLAQELLFYSRDRQSSDWIERVTTTALKPAIFATIWEKYGGKLPNDSVIEPWLVFELNFSESAAREVLRLFQKTIQFAKVESADLTATVSDDGADSLSEPEPSAMTAPAEIELHPAQAQSATSPSPESISGAATPLRAREAPSGTVRTVQLPYSRTRWALLQAEFPMSEAAWDQMIAVLNVMKPTLVEGDDD